MHQQSNYGLVLRPPHSRLIYVDNPLHSKAIALAPAGSRISDNSTSTPATDIMTPRLSVKEPITDVNPSDNAPLLEHPQSTNRPGILHNTSVMLNNNHSIELDYVGIEEDMRQIKKEISSMLSRFFRTLEADEDEGVSMVKRPAARLKQLYRGVFGSVSGVMSEAEVTKDVTAFNALLGFIGAFIYQGIFTVKGQAFFDTSSDLNTPRVRKVCEKVAGRFGKSVKVPIISNADKSKEFHGTHSLAGSNTKAFKTMHITLPCCENTPEVSLMN